MPRANGCASLIDREREVWEKPRMRELRFPFLSIRPTALLGINGERLVNFSLGQPISRHHPCGTSSCYLGGQNIIVSRFGITSALRFRALR
jgi:hypothetical protein